MKKMISLLLAASLSAQCMVFTPYAAEPDGSHHIIRAMPVLKDFEDIPLGAYEELPAKYFPKEELAPVKDQSTDSSCWAYSVTSAMEDSLYRKLGKKLEGDDLFDPQFFADVIENGRVSPLGLEKGDELRRIYLTSEYSTFLLSAKLSGCLGPMSYKQTSETDISDLGYGDSSYMAKNIYYIQTMDIDSVKRAVMKYGAVSLNINSNMYDSEIVSENGILKLITNRYQYIPFAKQQEFNHSVCIVGWDDTIPAEKFRYTDGETDYQCMYDGGFIIKNSWGDDPYYSSPENEDKWRIALGLDSSGEEFVNTDTGDGYFYISYYDQAIKSPSNQCIAFDMAEADHDENVYMYDGAGNISPLEVTQCANRFTALSPAGKGGEELVRAVVGINTPGKYTLCVYSCEDAKKAPWKQTLVGSKDFTAIATGFHSVEFDRGISFVKGEKFAVMLKRQNGEKFSVLTDKSAVTNWYEAFNYTEEGESWIDDKEYYDMEGITPMIKAVTKDCEVGASRSESLSLKAKIRAIPDQVYKGTEITLSEQDLLVYKGDTLLHPGLDYDVEYKKNTGVGKARVTVTPKTGNTTAVSASFYIVKDPSNPLAGKDKYCILSKESLDLSALYPDAAFELEKCKEAKLEGSTITGKKSGIVSVSATYPDGTKKDISIVVEKPKAEKVKAETAKEINIREFYSSLGYAYPISVTSSKPEVAEVTSDMKIKPLSKGSTKLTIVFSDKVKVTARLKVRL